MNLYYAIDVDPTASRLVHTYRALNDLGLLYTTALKRLELTTRQAIPQQTAIDALEAGQVQLTQAYLSAMATTLLAAGQEIARNITPITVEHPHDEGITCDSRRLLDDSGY